MAGCKALSSALSFQVFDSRTRSSRKDWRVQCSAQEGNSRVQEELVQLFRMQKKQVLIDEYVKTRIHVLKNIEAVLEELETKIADETDAPIDEKAAEVMGMVETELSAFELKLRLSRAKLEAQRKPKPRSKSSSKSSSKPKSKAPSDLAKKFSAEQQRSIREEANKIVESTKLAASSSLRISGYIVLVVSVTSAIAQAVITGEPFYKTAIFSGILFFLLLQLRYERGFANQNAEE